MVRRNVDISSRHEENVDTHRYLPVFAVKNKHFVFVGVAKPRPLYDRVIRKLAITHVLTLQFTYYTATPRMFTRFLGKGARCPCTDATIKIIINIINYLTPLQYTKLFLVMVTLVHSYFAANPCIISSSPEFSRWNSYYMCMDPLPSPY